MPEATVAVFDGHNDTLTQIRNAAPQEARSFLERSERGHVDLPRAREGGLAGGLFAVFTASSNYERTLQSVLGPDGAPVPGAWTVPLPPRLDRRKALSYTLSVISDLYRVARESAGTVRVVRTAAEIEACLDTGTFAAMLHIEGAESIDTRLEALDVFYEAGLRSLGPVWSRPTAFAHGVPFDFPRSPDTGPGLTAAGRRLVKACNRLGVLVDLSHMNEAGFWDVSRISHAPLVASHSGVHALCPSPRNLTEEQIRAIGASGGIVGVNYHKGFLRPDGDWKARVSVTEIVKHARHVADRIGVEHVGLGSDFDGATMPDDLGDVTGLPRLIQAFRDDGFTEDEIRAIAHGNWLRVLRETLGG